MLPESKALLFNNVLRTNRHILVNINSHKFSFFNDGGLKLGHFDILDMRFPLWHSLSYSPSELSEKRSRNGLATKGP